MNLRTLGDFVAVTNASGQELDAAIAKLDGPPRNEGEPDLDYRMRTMGITMERFDKPVEVAPGWYAPPGVYPVRRRA